MSDIRRDGSDIWRAQKLRFGVRVGYSFLFDGMRMRFQSREHI